MHTFTEFSEKFKNYVHAINSDYRDLVTEDFGRPPEKFIQNITSCLNESRMFLINENIKKLLCLTKTPNIKNSELRLPFNTIFLDVRFSREEAKKFGFKFGIVNEVVGIILNQMIVRKDDVVDGKWEAVLNDKLKLGVNEDKEHIAIGIRASILCNEDSKKDPNGAMTFSTFNFPYLEIDNQKKKVIVNEISTSKSIRKFVQTFSYNFLNFLYERDVEFVFNDYDPNRLRKRKAKGKFTPIAIGSIKIAGTLKKYINSISNESFEYSHSFWVRGHYKFLQSERYKEKRFCRIWTVPYIKNQQKGFPIDKTRELK